MKLLKFHTKDLTFMAVAIGLLFVIGFSIATGINAATGVPMMAGVVMVLIVGFLLSLYLRILRKPGVGTIIMTIYTTLAIPTMMFGPPGVYKVAIGFLVGLIIDIGLFLGRYKKWSYFLGFGIAGLLLAPIQLFFMVLLGIPNAEKLVSLIVPLIVVFFVEALIGTWLGLYTYRKIKHKKIIKQFSY